MKFLATTALESHWAENPRDMVFLGPWCRPFRDEAAWREGAGRELRDPFAQPEALAAARAGVDACYEELLGDLSKALASLHGVAQSALYWRIVLGPWLHTYVSVVYDRYVSLKAAFAELGEFRTLVCAGDEFEPPPDNYAYYYLLCTDEYNLSLYSRILAALGHRFETRPIATAHLKAADPRLSLPREIAKSAYARLVRLQQFFLSPTRPRLVLEDTYLGARLEWEIRAGFGRRCSIGYHRRAGVGGRGVRAEARAAIAAAIPPRSEFYRVLGALIAADIPIVFVEAFADLRRSTAKLVPPRGSVIASAGSWHHNDLFKHYAARAADGGSRLVALQHGGTYGVHDYVPHYHHEKKIAELFLSWGWKSRDCANVRPFVSSKLSRLPARPLGEAGEGILYIGTAEPRYSTYLQTRPHQYSRYLEWQRRFLGALPVARQQELLVRLYPVDFGWNLEKRWREWAPSVRKDPGRSLHESFHAARIVVIDALTTTWLEALSFNTPTVILLNREDLVLRPDAALAVKRMAAAGIAHSTPESAAAHVDAVCSDAASWWYSPTVQEAREAVCEVFARKTDDPVRDFSRAFKELLDETP